MDRGRDGSGNGVAFGDVARDVMDHASAIVRDELRLGKLSARRYAEHVRRDVAPRAAFGLVAGVLAGFAVLFGLIALFWGIASALGSVAWTFAIYAGFFAVCAIVAAALMGRPPHRETADEIARRFPAARARPTYPVHQLVVQETSPAAHAKEIEEARREATDRVVIRSS